MDLDISCNELKVDQMFEIIEALSSNRRLQFLNLSYNTISEHLD